MALKQRGMSWRWASLSGVAVVWRREVIAALRYWPSIFGGLATPLLLYGVFGVVLGDLMPSFGTISYRQFVVPAIVILQVALGTYYQAAYSTYYARNFTMTLEELLTSPLGDGDIILGRALGGMTIGLLTSLPLLVVLSWVSGISLSLSDLVLSGILLGLTGMLFSMLGMIIGLIAHNEFLLINASNLVIMPLIFLSDTFFPLSLYSPVLNRVIELSPVTFMMKQLRLILFADNSNLYYWLGMLVYLVLFLGLLAWIFKRQSGD